MRATRERWRDGSSCSSAPRAPSPRAPRRRRGEPHVHDDHAIPRRPAPAAINTFAPARTPAEAKALAARLNGAARLLRDQNERDAQHRRQEHEASAAHTARLSAWRPATRATTKASKLNPVDVYRTYNNRVRASALPEQRSSLCEAQCFGGVEVCDGETACWSKRLEEKGAAMRGASLNVTSISRERNAAAGWRAAVDQVNGARRTGVR